MLAHSFDGSGKLPLSEQQPSWKESLETSLEVIAESPGLRALLSAMPSVGGSLNELIAGKGQRIVEERRDNLLRLLAEHLETVEAESIRKDYFESPEGFDLLIRALDESRRTRSEEKRDLIARILAGATRTDAGQADYAPEDYLNMVMNLTTRELEVARTIYDSQSEFSPRELDSSNRRDMWRLQAEGLRERYGIDEGDLTLLANRFYSVGLLDLVYVLTPGSPTPTYWVSPAFEKLMTFLSLST